MTAMQSRRDQVQAQSYLVGRLTKAAVAAEPDAPESPTRRIVIGNLAGLLTACLVLAGFAVYGLLRPGGARTWQEPGTLILDRDTGSRYLRDDTGRLRPLLNLASARLLLGADPQVARVSTGSLNGVGHGTPVGIAGAPDALPGADVAVASTWTACTLPAQNTRPGTNGAPAGPGPASVVLAVTRSTAATSADRALDSNSAMVVGYGDDRFLIYNGRRHRFAESWMPRALGFDETTTMPATEAWLRSVPAGADIDPVRPARKATLTVGGRKVPGGRLYVVRGAGGPDRYYLADGDGLAPLSEFAYRIVLGDPARARLRLNLAPDELAAATLSATAVSTGRLLPPGLPDTVPLPVRRDPGQVPCLRYLAATGEWSIMMAVPSDETREPARGPGITTADKPAQSVVVEAGAGGLILAGWPGQDPDPVRYLVTDTGLRFPVGSADAATRLGYPDQSAVAVPPPLLDMLPTGPLLDQEVIRG